MEDPKDSSSSGDHSGADGTEANARTDSGAAAGGSTPQPSQQQLQLNALSATAADGLSQLAREAITAQPGASLYAGTGLLTAVQQPALAGAGTVTTDTPASASQAMLAGSDATLNALLLSGGLNLGNFAGMNQSALGTLLNDMNTSQIAGLQAGGFAGAGATAAVSGGAAANGGSNAAADGDDDGNRGSCNAQANNKQLSSRYRGVCWNKKNKRWQAAINSGGKYIYLGSFQSEDDAARQFDRAAIKIRGKKAKLNFLYADYVDADGNLLEDVILPIGKDDPKPGAGASIRAGRSSRGNDWGEFSDPVALQGDLINQAALALVGRGGWGGVGGFSENSDAANGTQQINMSDLKAFLPKGCSMDYMLPGLDAGMFGLVYKHDVTAQRGCGVWTGYKFHTFGLYIDEQDARQTVLRSMELLHEDRQARGVAGPAARGPAVSSGAQEAPAAAVEQDPLIAALGLGSLRTGAGSSSGMFGGGTGPTTTSRVGAMAGLADYDIAHAAQLAQQAAAEQGMSAAMPYPPLTVGLPAGGAADISTATDGGWQQQQLSSEADLQFKLQQIMQQRQDDSNKQATGGNGGVLSRLGNLDLAQLKQQLAGSLADTRQLLPQLQQRQLDKQLLPAMPLQQQAVAPAAANPITGALGSTSIEELLAGLTGAASKRTATAVAGSSAGGWGDILGLTGTGAATAGDVAAAALPAAKRLRVSDAEPGIAGISGITAAAATAAGAGAAAGMLGSGGEDTKAWSQLSKMGLQDALKSLYAMSGQGQQ